jgi:hypothetical protein
MKILQWVAAYLIAFYVNVVLCSFFIIGIYVEESMKIDLVTIFLSSFQILREMQNRPFQAMSNKMISLSSPIMKFSSQIIPSFPLLTAYVSVNLISS